MAFRASILSVLTIQYVNQFRIQFRPLLSMPVNIRSDSWENFRPIRSTEPYILIHKEKNCTRFQIVKFDACVGKAMGRATAGSSSDRTRDHFTYSHRRSVWGKVRTWNILNATIEFYIQLFHVIAVSWTASTSLCRFAPLVGTRCSFNFLRK